MTFEAILLTVLIIGSITIAIKLLVFDNILGMPNNRPLVNIDAINAIPTITNTTNLIIVSIITISEPIYKFKIVGLLKDDVKIVGKLTNSNATVSNAIVSL